MNKGRKLAPRPVHPCPLCTETTRRRMLCWTCERRLRSEAYARRALERLARAFGAISDAIIQERDVRNGVSAGETFRRVEDRLWQNERGNRIVSARCIKALARRGEIVVVDNLRAGAWPR